MIVKECQAQGIDSEIPVAISKLETGHYKSDACVYGNNVGGMSIDEVPIAYPDIQSGVKAFVTNLNNNYFKIGLTTPEQIGEKYCPVNTEWASTVRSLM